MKVTSVSVKIEKMFSDGNYGHQAAEVSYTAEVGDGEDPHYVTLRLLAMGNSHVNVQLEESETVNIRRALHPRPRVCNHCDKPLGDWDNYVHNDCEAKAREERDRKREVDRLAYAESLRHDMGARPTGQNGEDIEAEQDYGREQDAVGAIDANLPF